MSTKKKLPDRTVGLICFGIFVVAYVVVAFMLNDLALLAQLDLPWKNPDSLFAPMVLGLLVNIPATWIAMAIAAKIINTRYVIANKQVVVKNFLVCTVIALLAVMAFSYATMDSVSGSWLFSLLSFVESIVLLFIFSRNYIKTTETNDTMLPSPDNSTITPVRSPSWFFNMGGLALALNLLPAVFLSISALLNTSTRFIQTPTTNPGVLLALLGLANLLALDALLRPRGSRSARVLALITFLVTGAYAYWFYQALQHLEIGFF